MECSCFSANIDNYCEFIFEKTVTSTKKYKCVECSCAIPSNTLYHIEVAINDGVTEEYKTCMDCMSVREHLVCDFYYEQIWCLIESQLKYEINDTSIPWAKIGRLTPTARNKVCEIIEQNWAEDE